jgi:hypothetical protein
VNLGHELPHIRSRVRMLTRDRCSVSARTASNASITGSVTDR